MHREGWFLQWLFDHRLEENVDERRVTTSGGELGRLNIVNGAEIGQGHGLWRQESIMSLHGFHIRESSSHVVMKILFSYQLSDAGGKLIIASDGIWDASAANCCRAWFLAPSESESAHAASIFSAGSKPWQGAVAPSSLFLHKHPHRFRIFLLGCCHYFLMGCMIISLYLHLH
ncbi:unnamed protein product [Musa textilis]